MLKHPFRSSKVKVKRSRHWTKPYPFEQHAAYINHLIRSNRYICLGFCSYNTKDRCTSESKIHTKISNCPSAEGAISFTLPKKKENWISVALWTLGGWEQCSIAWKAHNVKACNSSANYCSATFHTLVKDILNMSFKACKYFQGGSPQFIWTICQFLLQLYFKS